MTPIRFWLAAVGAALIWGIPISNSAAATVDDILAKIDSNAARINSVEVIVDYDSVNTAKDGKILQRFSGRKHFWCDKASRKVRIEIESGLGNNELWDGITTKVKIKNASAGAVREENFPPPIVSIEDVWANPKYLYFPRRVLSGYVLSIGKQEGDMVTLVALPKGKAVSANDKQRTEFDVDVEKGVFTEVRTIGRSGDLIWRTELNRIKKYGECWLPTFVRETGFRKRNTVMFEYLFDEIKVNKVSPGDFNFQ